ncbi:MAG: dihydrofolate reductase [Patescibacteria group bacterium]
MQRTSISIIAAISQNRVIGKNGKLPWAIPEDMRRFRQLTAGHVVIMGRKTFESIGKPLKNRTNIVITRDSSYRAPGCTVVSSLEAALEQAKKVEHTEMFIIGGGEVYRQALPICDKLYLTVVHESIEGDAFFPDFSAFSIVEDKRESSDENHAYTFLKLTRQS